MKHGLFAALTREVSPAGTLDTTFTTEIMGATWRLRRCRIIESALAESADAGSLDDEAIAKEQKSVDRARAQTFTRLCRSISELRKIQTEHIIREQIHADVPGLTESKQVVSAMRLQNRAKSEAEQAQQAQQTPVPDGNPEAFDARLARAGRPAPAPPFEPAVSFCKPAPIAAAQPKNTPATPPAPAARAPKTNWPGLIVTKIHCGTRPLVSAAAERMLPPCSLWPHNPQNSLESGIAPTCHATTVSAHSAFTDA